MDGFEGDPKLILTDQGSDLVFRDGQPVMDAGLENFALISLFTKPGWPGNAILSDAEQIGSDFETLATGSITRESLANTQNAAALALSSDVLKVTELDVEIANPVGTQLDVRIRLAPPGEDVELLLTREFGLNWRSQAQDPANERI